MTGSNKELEQLIQNDSFIQWVTSPDEASDLHWLNWQQENYDRKELVLEARQIVLSIYNNEQVKAAYPNENVLANTWQRIDLQTREHEIIQSKRKIGWYKYAAAAAIIFAVATTWILTNPGKKEESAVSKTVNDNLHTAELLVTNNDEQDKIINLPDGSRIILAKNSSISYNRLFKNSTREVVLNGEAFFDIAKDASRPFYVYSGNVVTKVLGTSFRIVSDNAADKFTVAVKTGRVTVFRKDKEEEDKDKYVLAPSEQLVIEKIKATPQKQTVINKALIENTLPAVAQFDFESASLPVILKKLSDYYSVDILNESSRSEPCQVTASLSEGSLYDKLDLLHKVTGITYFIKDQSIFVDSKNCK